MDDVARQYWDCGVRHIVALRGDPPAGERYAAHPQGYAYASDLVAGLKRIADFEISVAAYPETHPMAESPQHDLDNLEAQAGCRRDPGDHAVFLRCRAVPGLHRPGRGGSGITASIVPGIMPVAELHPGRPKFSALCGTTVPDWLRWMFEGTEDEPEIRRTVAAVVAAEQVRLLQANGVDEFHFYTLNRPDLTYAIAHILGVRHSEHEASR